MQAAAGPARVQSRQHTQRQRHAQSNSECLSQLVNLVSLLTGWLVGELVICDSASTEIPHHVLSCIVLDV